MERLLARLHFAKPFVFRWISQLTCILGGQNVIPMRDTFLLMIGTFSTVIPTTMLCSGGACFHLLYTVKGVQLLNGLLWNQYVLWDTHYSSGFSLGMALHGGGFAHY